MIAVSLFAEDPRRLRARLRLLAGRVPWVELRLDRAPADLDLGGLRRAFPELRFLAAWRPMEPERADERAAVLTRAAAAGFDLLDWPLGAPAPPALAAARIVHSFHEPEGARADLAEALARGLAAARAPGEPGGDLIKIVARAGAAEDAARVLALFAAAPRGSLLAFAMGPGGGASRVWSPALGAPWSFACWPGEETAPGQLDWRALAALLPPRAEPEAPLFGVVGRPVAHSLSPALWSVALRLERPDSAAAYAACAAGDLAAFLAAHERLRTPCGAPRCAAFSVTAPFKEEAFRLATEADPAAVDCRAANFLLRTPRGWRAANTDGPAALDAMRDAGLAGRAPVLLLGAGGAARAAAAEALRRGHPATVAARRPEQAAALAADLAGLGRITTAEWGVDALGFGGVIQATTLGSAAQPGDAAAGRRFARGAVALDMVYEPERTAFLSAAAAQGAVAVGGAEMLLRQMLAQFRLARGQEPPAPPLRAALRAALRARRPDPRRALALIGPRASGKSTLGRALASALGREFVDADAELERRSGRALAAWLPADPDGFRAAEAGLLAELLERRDAVLALGGGVVETAGARALLSAHGAVIWLHVEPEEQLRRRGPDDTRPPLTALPFPEEVRAVHARRTPWYRACADRCVETGQGIEYARADLLRAAAELGCGGSR